MDWTMIGAVGELLGAVAVVVSLIYVARQVRDSSNAAQRAHYLELNREITNFADGIAREDEWSDIVYRGFIDRSTLTPKEILRFNAGVLGVFRSWEAVFPCLAGAWGPRVGSRGTPLRAWRTSSGTPESRPTGRTVGTGFRPTFEPRWTSFSRRRSQPCCGPMGWTCSGNPRSSKLKNEEP